MDTVMDKKALVFMKDALRLHGDLVVPQQAYAVVIFAHGSGSSRHSPRNQMVAEYLNGRRIATFLFDLLTEEEDRDFSNRFNIEMLANRLKEVTQWLLDREDTRELHAGFFGASTGAAAALMAASDLSNIRAVVSRGGRPDLALKLLPLINVPTLLIVGELDPEVIKLNRKAYDVLKSKKQMEVISHAGHLFGEKGAMEKVCLLAAHWFEEYLQPMELTD
jgi:putative phosphoribosyl transferase